MSERNVSDGVRQAWDRVTACMDEQAKARATMLAGIAERTLGFKNERVAEALEAAYREGFLAAKRGQP